MEVGEQQTGILAKRDPGQGVLHPFALNIECSSGMHLGRIVNGVLGLDSVSVFQYIRL